MIILGLIGIICYAICMVAAINNHDAQAALGWACSLVLMIGIIVRDYNER